MTRRQYVWYCLAVSIGLVVFKVVVGADVPATSLFADDHEYLNRSPYILRADLGMSDYPFSRTEYGPLYPLVVSPWMLVTDPGTRIHIVFGINALLSAIVVMCGSLTVFQLARTASVLVPFCLAAFPPLFLFTFYAMSENLMFALLAMGALLVVDFETTCRRPLRAALLLLIVMTLPLVRVPGLAMLLPVGLLVWRYRDLVFRSVPGRLLALGATVLPTLAYAGVYLMGMRSRREGLYLSALERLGSDQSLWRFPLELTGNQLGYVFFTTGGWIMPLLLVMAWQVWKRPADSDRRRWVNYLIYAGVGSAGFVAFAVVHLVQKLNPTESDFIYGRYNDPAAVLLVIGGLAAALSVRPQGLLARVLLRVVAPLGICLLLARFSTKFWIPPANQSGLAIFAGHYWPVSYYATAVTFLVAVQLLSNRRRLYAPAAMLFLLAYSTLTSHSGTVYAARRARRALPGIEAARWIVANLPADARIGYDASILEAPALRGHKTMRAVYRAMAFRVHPRVLRPVLRDSDLAGIDYFYTRASGWRPKKALVLWRRVYEPMWSNDSYAVYRISPEGRRARAVRSAPPATQPAD